MKRRSTKRTSRLNRCLRAALALFMIFTFLAISPSRKVEAFIVPDNEAPPRTGVQSEITMPDLGPVTSVAVRLTINAMPKPNDIDMLLLAPGGMINLEFMSDAGGVEPGPLVPLTITLSDSGSGNGPVPDSGPLVDGEVYQPGDYGEAEEASAWGLPLADGSINHATDNGPATFTSVFTGIPSAGTWTLLVRDESGPNAGDTDISSWTLIINGTTAATGTIGGHIATADGTGVSGTTVRLGGTQSRKTITDANGDYRFDQVETNGFYTVTPARATFNFSPTSRSFNQLAAHTDALFTANPNGEALNPLDTPEYFVRQQYVDLLGREPEESGFNYWSDRILECGADLACQNARRRDVATAFFIEAEFQQTDSFIYRLYKGALGRKPAFAEFSLDRQHVVGGSSLETLKQAFAESFVQRSEFMQKYQTATGAESFVDALLSNVQQASGIDLSSQRADLIARYNAGANLGESRSLALRGLTESAAFVEREYNAAFVLFEYFAFLRRDPDSGGYDFWLDVLGNREPGNFRGMVCAFITSTEYQQRFSNIVSHSNAECAQ